MYSLTVEVGDGVGVGLGEAVRVGEGDGVGDAETEGVGEAVGVGVTETEGVAVAVGVGVGVGVGVEVIVGVEDAVGVGDATGVAVGATLIFTPLLQTLFVPRLMHLNSLPPDTTTAPNFLQVAPAIGVTAVATLTLEKTKAKASKWAIRRRICES